MKKFVEKFTNHHITAQDALGRSDARRYADSLYCLHGILKRVHRLNANVLHKRIRSESDSGYYETRFIISSEISPASWKSRKHFDYLMEIQKTTAEVLIPKLEEHFSKLLPKYQVTVLLQKSCYREDRLVLWVSWRGSNGESESEIRQKLNGDLLCSDLVFTT